MVPEEEFLVPDQTEYMYRFRFYNDQNTNRPGWTTWEIVDEKKYNEILTYIRWDIPCRYQAQKLRVVVIQDEMFDKEKCEIEHWAIYRITTIKEGEHDEEPVVEYTRDAGLVHERRLALNTHADWVTFEASMDNQETWQRMY